ncbi:MAG: hypothetical protein AB7E37_02880 [Candidatus Altimarinota bacterium]
MKKTFIYFLFLVFSLYSCTTNENTLNIPTSNTNDNSVTNNSQSDTSGENLNQNIKLSAQSSNTTRTRFDTRSRAS